MLLAAASGSSAGTYNVTQLILAILLIAGVAGLAIGAFRNNYGKSTHAKLTEYADALEKQNAQYELRIKDLEHQLELAVAHAKTQDSAIGQLQSLMQARDDIKALDKKVDQVIGLLTPGGAK